MRELPLLLGLGVASAFRRLEAAENILFGDTADDFELRNALHEGVIVDRLLLLEELVHGRDVFQLIVEGVKGVIWLHGTRMPERPAPMQISGRLTASLRAPPALLLLWCSVRRYGSGRKTGGHRQRSLPSRPRRQRLCQYRRVDPQFGGDFGNPVCSGSGVTPCTKKRL